MEFRYALKHLENLEKRMSEFYDWLSLMLDSDKDASAFFSQMGKEESSHRDIVRFQERLAQNSPEYFSDVEIEMKELETLINLVEEFKETHTNPSLREALDMAFFIEGNAAERHFKKAMETSNKSLGNLIKRLGKEDEAHSEMLEDFVRSRRLNRVAQMEQRVTMF